jgi:hypothetical protein
VKSWYMDYGIDLVLMILHVARAAVLAWVFRRVVQVSNEGS